MLNAKGLKTKVKQNNKSNQKYFRFEKLEVWKDAREFASLIYKISSKFPLDEKFGPTNQIRRAAISIALNIAEGSAKGSDPDLRRYLKMAQGSTNEVITATYIALDQQLLTTRDFQEIYDHGHKINAKINSFINAMSLSVQL